MAKLDLPYIQSFKDRHGKQRHYYRRKGQPSVALPGHPGSAEFMAAYADAAASSRVSVADVSSRRPESKTIHALVGLYFQSQEFRDLAAATQRNYRSILDRFREQHGAKSAVTVGAHHLEAIFASMAGRPGATRNLRKRLNRVFRLAVRLGWRRDNPITETEAPRTKSSGFPPWTEEEITAYLAYWGPGTRERLALLLLLCLGQRRGDTRLMGRQHMVGPNRIRVIQQKGGAELVIRIHPDLLAEMALHPKAMTFVTTQYGAPFSAAGFTQWFVERAVMAGIRARTPHGLRKAAGRRLAEAGCTSHQIMSILGHKSLSEAERYTRDARQTLLADEAMDKLEAETRTPSVKPV